MPESELLESDTVYCTVSDVERQLRGVEITEDSDPTAEEVAELIKEASSEFDSRTGRAWRERRIKDNEIRVKFPREAKNSRLRHRAFRANAGVAVKNFRGRAQLGQPHVREFDPEKDDELVALLASEEKDIIDDEGRGRDASYVVDYPKGVVKPNVYVFRATKVPGAEIVSSPRIRATYRYGRDMEERETEHGNTVTSAPGTVKTACAKWVAAHIHETDDYSMTMNEGTGGSVNPDQTASQYRDDFESAVARKSWGARF